MSSEVESLGHSSSDVGRFFVGRQTFPPDAMTTADNILLVAWGQEKEYDFGSHGGSVAESD
ncbi:MAG: hypothetical protein OIF58_05810 [Cohaesibacter sp.]|nr:hypothetical protein [Cohaesibacter sp.]